MGDSGTPLVSVTQTRDGVWSVNERGPTRVAIVFMAAVQDAPRVLFASAVS